ncbi:MAG: hypothetical protein IJX77_04860 [Ruminococcus sp.]|nr:hypothetical protein [Ruminococcus sp.]
MKTFVKTMITGALAGAVITLLISLAVAEWLDRPLSMGGEFLLPALVVLVGYIGWTLANNYFEAVKYKEIYRKGYEDGVKVHRYKIIIPVEEDTQDEQTCSRIA